MQLVPPGTSDNSPSLSAMGHLCPQIGGAPRGRQTPPSKPQRSISFVPGGTMIVVRFPTPRSIAGLLSFALTGFFRNSLRTFVFHLLRRSTVALDLRCGFASAPWRNDPMAASPARFTCGESAGRSQGPAARHRRAVFFSDRRPFPRRWLGCVAHAVIDSGGEADTSTRRTRSASINRILAEFGPFSDSLDKSAGPGGLDSCENGLPFCSPRTLGRNLTKIRTAGDPVESGGFRSPMGSHPPHGIATYWP